MLFEIEMKEKNITHMKLRLKLPRGFLLIRAQSVGTATKNTLLCSVPKYKTVFFLFKD